MNSCDRRWQGGVQTYPTTFLTAHQAYCSSPTRPRSPREPRESRGIDAVEIIPWLRLKFKHKSAPTTLRNGSISRTDLGIGRIEASVQVRSLPTSRPEWGRVYPSSGQAVMRTGIVGSGSGSRSARPHSAYAHSHAAYTHAQHTHAHTHARPCPAQGPIVIALVADDSIGPPPPYSHREEQPLTLPPIPVLEPISSSIENSLEELESTSSAFLSGSGSPSLNTTSEDTSTQLSNSSSAPSPPATSQPADESPSTALVSRYRQETVTEPNDARDGQAVIDELPLGPVLGALLRELRDLRSQVTRLQDTVSVQGEELVALRGLAA